MHDDRNLYAIYCDLTTRLVLRVSRCGTRDRRTTFSTSDEVEYDLVAVRSSSSSTSTTVTIRSSTMSSLRLVRSADVANPTGRSVNPATASALYVRLAHV